MTAAEVLKKARGEIGVSESPKNSNRVKYNTAYYGREVSGADYPWCCVFVWWVFHSLGASALFYGGRPTAYCPAVEEYYKKAGRWYSTPKVGDLALYDFNKKGIACHIGIVESVNSDGTITAIEGNTALTNNDNGGAVMRRVRSLKQVRGFARPEYEEGSDTVKNLLTDGIITTENEANWRAFIEGTATPKPEYIKAVFDRYHKKLGEVKK